ncbi:E3 ubiquitin--protein ligase [Bradyrhizobium brasilense]|nr:E3 ubiquitin--protein ligase [Bradyrhizobium brasilense]
MNTERAQPGAGIPSEFESTEPASAAAGRSCSCLPQWASALTRWVTGAAAADRVSSQDRALASWAAEEGQGEDENRQEGVDRTRAWRDEGTVRDELNLSSLSLTTLPASLPPRLRTVIVIGNQLSSLPTQLPGGLRDLYASDNRLTSLPALPSRLRNLHLMANDLTSLPAELPSRLRSLMVDGNQLTDLPALPATIEEFSAGNNQLTSLPELPARLRRLDVSENQLTSLPDLPARLRYLDASDNQLTSLPEIPARLGYLDVSENQLTNLPETLPVSLEMLGASNNRLTGLPATVLTQLGSASSIDLRSNPIPAPVLADLASATRGADYAGPQVLLSMPLQPVEHQPRSLHEVVADWLVDEPGAVDAWQGFAEEQGAQDFALFLERLAGTVNYGHRAFRDQVAETLLQAAMRPKLREQYFELANGATASCEDRITLTWNGMQTARVNADVKDGLYDNRLDQLLQHGRVMFRLGALDDVARETVSSLRRADPEADIDEIEVYLAYQTQLRDRLELHHIAPDMRFLNLAEVTADDVARAETSVRQQEATGFADFLATRWEPWDTAVRRIAPDNHAAARDRIADAIENEFPARLNERLAEHGLTDDVDAQRVVGAQILSEIAHEIKGELMHEFLREHGLEP